MSNTIVALGEQALLEGFLLTGAKLYIAETEGQAHDAWAALPAETGIVILTPFSAQALGSLLDSPRSPMTVVLPS